MKKDKTGMEYWKKIIILLFFGWSIIWIYRTILTPVFGEIQQTIGVHTNSQMGLISSFYFFGYTALQIPSGILVDRFGKKVILVPSFILFAIAAVIIGFSSNISMLYMGSLLAGIGCGSYYGAAFSLNSQGVPEEKKGLSAAIISCGTAMGMAVGLIASSYFVKIVHIQWNYMLFFIAFLIICAAAAFVFLIKPEDKPAKIGREKKKVDIKGLLSMDMIANYLVYFATCYGYYMIVTWLPSFLQEERGFQGLAVGFSSSLVAFSAILGSLFFSRLYDKKRNLKIQLVVFLEVIAGLMILFMVIAPSSIMLIAGLLLYGFFGKLAVDPVLISHVLDISPKESTATYLGTFNFFGMCGSVLAPFITGFISDQTASKAMGFYLAAILLIVGAVLFFCGNIKRKRIKESKK